MNARAPKNDYQRVDIIRRFTNGIVEKTISQLVRRDLLPPEQQAVLVETVSQELASQVHIVPQPIERSDIEANSQTRLLAAAIAKKATPKHPRSRAFTVKPRIAPPEVVSETQDAPDTADLLETLTDAIDPDAYVALEIAKLWGSRSLAAANVRLLMKASRTRRPDPEWLTILEETARKLNPAPKRTTADTDEKTVKKPRKRALSKKPAVPIEESVHRDYIVCLIDGEKRSMLSRYLLSKYGMTAERYRRHFGLPDDYPLTCEAYRDEKQKLALRDNLGHSPLAHRKKKG